MQIKFFLIISFTIWGFKLQANDSIRYFFVYFKDKQNTEYSLNKPEKYLSYKAVEKRNKLNIKIDSSDLPVSKDYIKSLARFGFIKIINQSKWLNGVHISTKESKFKKEHIEALTFVKSVIYLATEKVKEENKKPEFGPPSNPEATNNYNISESNQNYWGKAHNQNNLINAIFPNKMLLNYTIAIFDAGFSKAYQTKGMQGLYSNAIIQDFVDYDNSVWEDDRHGANCLSFMRSNSPNQYVGTAPFANYVLIRTENAALENLNEEINWLLAAEFCDSLGVDLISSSLGYTAFDDINTNHTYSDLDGKTTIIAKAADFAFKKGIVVVNSAGNEGNGKWHKIGSPADAENVITIGSVDMNGFHSKFSSYGPSYDGRIKPNFVSMGQNAIVNSPGGNYAGNGTSYSTPIFAGAFANYMAINPNLPYNTIKKALEESSTHYFCPDSAYGFGIPDFVLANKILNPENQVIDYLHSKTDPVFFQDLNIHFKSAHNQNFDLMLYYKSKGKLKLITKIEVYLTKDAWFHNADLLKTYNSMTPKKLKKTDALVYILVSKDITIQKIIPIIK